MLFAGYLVSIDQMSLTEAVVAGTRRQHRRLLDRLGRRHERRARPARAARPLRAHHARAARHGRSLVRAARRAHRADLPLPADHPHVHLAARRHRAHAVLALHDLHRRRLRALGARAHADRRAGRLASGRSGTSAWRSSTTWSSPPSSPASSTWSCAGGAAPRTHERRACRARSASSTGRTGTRYESRLGPRLHALETAVPYGSRRRSSTACSARSRCSGREDRGAALRAMAAGVVAWIVSDVLKLARRAPAALPAPVLVRHALVSRGPGHGARGARRGDLAAARARSRWSRRLRARRRGRAARRTAATGRATCSAPGFSAGCAALVPRVAGASRVRRSRIRGIAPGGAALAGSGVRFSHGARSDGVVRCARPRGACA